MSYRSTDLSKNVRIISSHITGQVGYVSNLHIYWDVCPPVYITREPDRDLKGTFNNNY